MSGGEHHFLMFYYSIIFAGNVNLSLGEVAFLSFPIFPPDIMLDLEHIPGFPGGSNGKESACNAGDLCSIPGSGIFPGGGFGNPLQHSCLESSMDRGAFQITVRVVSKSWTRLAHRHTPPPTHTPRVHIPTFCQQCSLFIFSQTLFPQSH